MPFFSAGELIRELINSGCAEGKQLQDIILQGQIIPSEVRTACRLACTTEKPGRQRAVATCDDRCVCHASPGHRGLPQARPGLTEQPAWGDAACLGHAGPKSPPSLMLHGHVTFVMEDFYTRTSAQHSPLQLSTPWHACVGALLAPLVSVVSASACQNTASS